MSTTARRRNLCLDLGGGVDGGKDDRIGVHHTAERRRQRRRERQVGRHLRTNAHVGRKFAATPSASIEIGEQLCGHLDQGRLTVSALVSPTLSR